MSDNELLSAISEMMDRKLEPIHADIIELKMDVRELQVKVENLEVRVKNLKTDMKGVKSDIKELQTDVKELQTDMKVMQAKMENLEFGMKKMQIRMESDVSPRLQNIESCYLSTYQRYSEGAGQIDSMQMDIDVLKSTVIEHSEKLQRIS